MKAIKTFVVVALLLFLGVYFLDKSAKLAKNESVYVYYVMHVYMPRSKREFGAWPENLDGLPQFVRKESHYLHQDIVLQFHENRYEGMKVTKSNNISCSFALNLNGETKNYNARLDREDKSIEATRVRE